MFYIDPVEALKIAGTAVEIFEKRSQITTLIQKFVFWCTQGQLQTPIFGLGGTGKSTLGGILAGKLDPTKGRTEYSVSIMEEEFQMQGGILCTLLVPPGQPSRQAFYWSDLKSLVAAGKVKILINVVSYGYHSLEEESYKLHKDYENGKTAAEFFKKYAENRRADEEKSVASLVDSIAGTGRRLRMLTIVTKQDLWWNQRETVKKHYMEGAYNASIKDIAGRLGARNFQHEFLSVSLVSANLLTRANERLADVESGYDDPVRIAHVKQLVDVFYKFTRARR